MRGTGEERVSFVPSGRRILALFLIALAAAAWMGPANSAPAPLASMATVSNPDSALDVALTAIEGSPLTLQEAIRAALNGGSTAARNAAAAFAAARGTHRREVGAFDPELFFTGAKAKDNQPTTSPFSGANPLETTTTSGVGGARITLPFGTDISASIDGSRTETNSAFSAVNPEYDSAGRIALRQPLLKGFGPGTGSEAKATKREAEAAQARYDDVTIGVRTQVEQVYWDLYAAERDLAVSRLIRDQAQALETQAELRARSGLVGPNDVANARVFLAEQEQTVLDREEDLDKTSDFLANLIGRRPPDGSPRYRPTDAPPTNFPIEPEDSVVVRALRDNRAIHAFERDLAAAHARVQGAGWNRLPQLDFVGSLGGRGLSGTGQTVIFGADTLSSNVDGNFSDATKQVTNRDFPTWSAGIQISVPLFLREGRGDYDRLRGEEDQAAERLEGARRSLGDDVRTAHRALVRAAKRFEAAQSGAEASRDQVRIGVLQYNSGRTTAFELVRLGADLASAQQRYSAALVRTAKAESALRFLTSSGYSAEATPSEGQKP